jgi:class 3 adenylate cyclase
MGHHSGTLTGRCRGCVVTQVDLPRLLGDLDDTVKNELASTPEVVDVGDDLHVGALPIVARRWHKVSDAVAVVADLKSSTKLGTGKWAASTASIYEASTGSVVRIFDEFDADFLAIQGDGAFGLFWGERRYERALCAGITIKTFSRDMVERLEKRWQGLPETGFKVGVASSRLLAKRIGTPRNPAQQEPVWAGKAVNYAAKAAQGADRHIMVVTGSVWDRVEKNDYLAFSCPCGTGPSLGIWEDTEIERLPDGDPEAQGRALTAAWCSVHGEEYCAAVLEGRRSRRDVDELRKALAASQMRNAIRLKAKNERTALRARKRGLAS